LTLQERRVKQYRRRDNSVIRYDRAEERRGEAASQVTIEKSTVLEYHRIITAMSGIKKAQHTLNKR